MIPMQIEGVRRNIQRSDFYNVTLLDATQQRQLTIAITRPDSYTLVMALNHIDETPPVTLHAMSNILILFHILLEEVRIETILPSPIPFLFATARLRREGEEQSVDVPTKASDALVLATLMNGPILVSEQVLETIGTLLPEGMTPEVCYAQSLLKHEQIVLPEGKQLRLGYSKTPAKDAVTKEVKAALLGIPQPPTQQEHEQARKDYLRFLLGDNYEQYRQQRQ